jgi:ubiquinone/menaquinone biosynthesis C-methylase UbiE
VTNERLERSAVFDLAGPLAALDVLDVGCGDGAYALAAAVAGGRVTGVDASATAVEAAQRQAGAAGLGAAFLVGDASQLPSVAERFDVLLAVTVLCFVPDPEEAVVEMARVLRPGGLLVLADLGRCSPWGAWRRMRGWAGNATWRRARFWTVGDLRALMRGVGVEPAQWRAAAF